MRLIAILLFVFPLCAKDAEEYYDNPNSHALATALTDLNAEPSSIVANCVNAITGDFVDFDTDLVIPGPEPILIQRSHTSSDTGSDLLYQAWRTNHQGKIKLDFDKSSKHQTIEGSYRGPCGERMHFEGEGKKSDAFISLKTQKKMYAKGLTNTSKGTISGQTNPCNTRLLYDNGGRETCWLHLGSGEVHRFKRRGKDHEYFLREITTATGMHFHYSYANGKLNSVHLRNILGSEVSRVQLHFDPFPNMEKHTHWIAFQGQDGRAVNYKFQDFSRHRKYFILTDVLRSDGPPVHYTFHEAHYTRKGNHDWNGNLEQIKRKELPDGRFVEIEYYRKGDNEVLGQNHKIKDYNSDRLNRVKEIKQPVGEGGAVVSTYKFVYNLPKGPGQTKAAIVYDAYNRKAEYWFNQEDRLIHLIQFDAQNNPYTSEKLFWGALKTRQQINLQWRVFGSFLSPKKDYARAYNYDSQGNVLSDTLFGIITGSNLTPLLVNGDGAPISNGCESKTTQYTYTNFNLVHTVKEGDVTVEYTYLPQTSLVVREIHRDSEGIFRRYFYWNDENGLIHLKIEDDGKTYDHNSLEGVTERFITRIERSKSYPVGLPVKESVSCIDLSTGSELSIREQLRQFDIRGRLIVQETYGSDGNFAYRQEWEYNDFGNLTKETDVLGRTIHRRFDQNGNCIYEEGPLPGLSKEMVYDPMNRLIAIHEHHADGITLTQSFGYDYRGNKIRSTDAFGNTTHHHYDPFGRMIYEEGPGIENLNGGLTAHTATLEYNTLSQIIRQKDAYGNTTSTKYTIFGKPYEVILPDGTVQKYRYDLQSNLIESISPTGAKTQYIRDGRGRVLAKELFNLNGELYAKWQYRYNQTHLLEEIDPLGNTTSYNYDAYGRIRSIIKRDQLIEYEYDHLGRKISTLNCNPERTEGTITRLKLDAAGQILEEKVYDISEEIYTVSQFEYDEIGRKIKTTFGDAITTFVYDTHGLLTKTIDPEGNITTQTADYFFFNSFGQRVLKTHSIDPKGVQTVTTHDIRGQISSIEINDPFGAPLKSEKFIRDLNGNLLQKTTTPEPARVYRFEYDEMNRLLTSYQAYGTKDQKQFSTIYNALGQKEKLIKPDGVQITYAYDEFNRVTSCLSSDGTIADYYEYDACNNPIRITNQKTSQKTLRTFDSNGRVLEEIHQNGLKTRFTYNYDGSIKSFTLPDESQVSYSYKAGYCVEAARKDALGNNKYSHTILKYDRQGNALIEMLPEDLGLLERKLSKNGNLLSMNSPYFGENADAYDPLGNLLSRTITDTQGSFSELFKYDYLNQLQEEKGIFNHTYKHDAHQNRLQKDDTTYTNNQLNQLLTNGDSPITYDLNGNILSIDGYSCTYDALDRLISVSKDQTSIAYQYDELNRCIQRGEDRYFYITEVEVGVCSSNAAVKEFQMVGPGRASAPCQALVMEIDGSAYSVLHDQSGHVRTLIRHDTRTASNYRYSAFGEKQTNSTINAPWTFAGKREDAFTSWIQFGKRFYLPEIGRFLTQDPAGITASPNLYAYLANSPLIRYDTFGLFESEPSFSSKLHNMASKVANAASEAFSTGMRYLNQGRRFTGQAIHDLSHHLIPIPFVKDIPKAAGYFIANLSMKGFEHSLEEQQSRWIRGNGWERPNVRHLSENGICNQSSDMSNMQASVQNAFDGERTDHLAGASHGLVMDLVHCVLLKLGVTTHQVRTLVWGMKRAFNEVGSDGHVTIDAHSRGGSVLERALPYLTDDQRSRLTVTTYGTASIIDPKGLHSATNHVSERDLITFIANPVTYVSSLFKRPAHVKFLPANTRFFEHGFQGKTYQEALKDSAREFMKKNQQ